MLPRPPTSTLFPYTTLFRSGGAKLFQRVVAGEHRAGMNAAMAGGSDVMFHVTDEERFVGLKIVFAQDLMDFFAFIPHIGIGLVEKGVEAVAAALRLEMIRVNGAQEKGAEFFRATEFQELPGVRQF